MSQHNLEKLYLKIRIDKFYLLKFILEAYDGMAILSSSGSGKDIVLVRYPREERNNVLTLLSALAENINPYRENL
jgi:hypothetical protein